MKNIIFILFLFLLSIPGSSQIKQGYEYSGRFTPVIKQEKLKEAKLLNDIMPEFCRYFALPYKERCKFNQLLKLEDIMPGNYSYSQKYFYHQEKFERIIDYISIEITASCNNKSVTSKSKSNVLTAEQKNILKTADLGSDISIKIKFKYNYQSCEFPEDPGNIQEGKYTVTVLPQTEAEYPGGFKQISDHINKYVINKIPKAMLSGKIQNAIVKFTITEEGKIIDAKISRTSTDPKIDILLIDAINKMQKWKPAENAKGIKVKQEYSIPLGGGGC